MKNAVFIISDINDPEVDSVQTILHERQESVIRFDTTRFAKGEVTISLFDSGNDVITDGSSSVLLKEIKSVWYTAPFAPHPPLHDPKERAFAKEELKALMENMFYLIPDAFWISSPEAVTRAEKKMLQLQVARRVGLLIPETCITNDPVAAALFMDRSSAQYIYKTLHFPYFLTEYDKKSSDESITAIPASLVRAEHKKMLDSIAYSGAIFQKYLDKDYEIRVTVVGTHVFPACIDSQRNSDIAGKADWRHGEVSIRTMRACKLPHEIAEKCIALVQALGLYFGAIDMVKTSSGDYVFLEVNSAGSFHWAEKITKLPIARAIASALAHPPRGVAAPVFKENVALFSTHKTKLPTRKLTKNQ